MKRHFLIIASVIAILSTGVFAQTTKEEESSDTEARPIEELSETIEVMTRVLLPTDIQKDQPQAIDLKLLKVPGATPELTEGVTAKGYARYVDVEGEKIGQLVLVGIEKGGKAESLDSTSYTAQFEMEQPRLEPGEDVKVEADGPALIAALKRLAEGEEEEKPEAERAVSAGIGISEGGGAGDKKSSSYETPPPVAQKEQEAESFETTANGCSIRVDHNKGQAVQQTKTVTKKGGKVVSEDECSDSAESFALKRSYAVCTDEVDLKGRKATSRFQIYYVDSSGKRHEVGDCQKDEDKVFKIVEDDRSCTISIDPKAGTATPQSALIYRDENNADVQVRGCQPSETKKPIKMVMKTEGCSIRHDFKAGKSEQMGVNTYEQGGLTYRAGDCVETGTTYGHKKIYKSAAGQYICKPVVDMASKKVTLQSRVQITTGKQAQFISDCAPDAAGALSVVATTDGCENPATWAHDLGAGVSYATERFYYLNGKTREYVTTCQKSTVSYKHQVETTGWKMNDEKLAAWPVTSIYINTSGGRHTIKSGEVQAGAIQQPYKFISIIPQENGMTEYLGCSAVRLRDQIKIWNRPDNTEFKQKIGTFRPTDPVNVCDEEAAESKTVVVGYYYYADDPIRQGMLHGRDPNDYFYGHPIWNVKKYEYEQEVRKINIKNRETEKIVRNRCERIGKPKIGRKFHEFTCSKTRGWCSYTNDLFAWQKFGGVHKSFNREGPKTEINITFKGKCPF